MRLLVLLLVIGSVLAVAAPSASALAIRECRHVGWEQICAGAWGSDKECLAEHGPCRWRCYEFIAPFTSGIQCTPPIFE